VFAFQRFEILGHRFEMQGRCHLEAHLAAQHLGHQLAAAARASGLAVALAM
jgi:hypothetical protein